jgi:hypothetical protein
MHFEFPCAKCIGLIRPVRPILAANTAAKGQPALSNSA